MHSALAVLLLVCLPSRVRTIWTRTCWNSLAPADLRLGPGFDQPNRSPLEMPDKRPFADRRPPATLVQVPYQTQRAPTKNPLVHSLGKAVSRQQEELRVLRQDTAFLIFMKPGQDSMMARLFQVAMQFKAKKEPEPIWQLGQMPVRMVLANGPFHELINGLNQTWQRKKSSNEPKTRVGEAKKYGDSRCGIGR